MTKFYVDGDGNYIGGFDGADPPSGSIEVPAAPEDARQTWNGASWSAKPPPPTNDELYDQNIQQNKVFKAYVLAVNDGSIVPGSNMTGAALKAAVTAKM